MHNFGAGFCVWLGVARLVTCSCALVCSRGEIGGHAVHCILI